MTQLTELRKRAHSDFLNIRNIKYIVETDDFELTYRKSPIKYRESILLAISKGDKNKLKQLVKERLLKLTPFDKMTIRQLRSIAKHNSIPNYWYLSKVELIEGIENVVKRLKENSKQVLYQPKETINQ